MNGLINCLKNRKLTDFNVNPIRDLGNMKVLQEENIPIDYVVLKVKGKTFSTKMGDFNQGVAKIQLVNTKEIGNENNIWIKGVFVEKGNHEELSEKIDFELNVYTKINHENYKK